MSRYPALVFRRCVGSVFIAGFFFFITLQMIDYLDQSSAPIVEGPPPTFAEIVDSLENGKVVVLHLDDNAIEDRDQNGHVRCGPETAKGYLGIFVAGQNYLVSYDRGQDAWTTMGPQQTARFNRSTGTCEKISDTYYSGKPRAIKVDPKEGKLVVWGLVMTFDSNSDVWISSRDKVGHFVSLKR